MLADRHAGGGRLGRQLKKWSATLLANALSTYVLDTVSTAAGVLLAASGLLSDAGWGPLLVFLGASYVVWGYGLSSSLDANWRLLASTGTSTSALSKLAYDLTSGSSPRTRRLLAAGGYVLFELLKELPYYLAAFGLALASDTVTAEQATIFLGGANLGAAAYEATLGWSTRSMLRRKDPAGYASFEREWSTLQYLTSYYGSVDEDERETIAFFSAAAPQMPPDEPALVFGAGPTLHHVFLMAEKASEIHVGDYLSANLDAISRWIGQEPGAHDWQPFVAYTLQCEGAVAVDRAAIAERETLTRQKVSALLDVDIRKEWPLGASHRLYGTVLSAYCVDSATSDIEAWRLYMTRVAQLVRPGGTLLVAALGRTHSYFVGDNAFPSPCLDEADLRAELLGFFRQADLTVHAVDVPGCAAHGYSRIILAAGHNRL